MVWVWPLPSEPYWRTVGKSLLRTVMEADFAFLSGFRWRTVECIHSYRPPQNRLDSARPAGPAGLARNGFDRRRRSVICRFTRTKGNTVRTWDSHIIRRPLNFPAARRRPARRVCANSLIAPCRPGVRKNERPVGALGLRARKVTQPSESCRYAFVSQSRKPDRSAEAERLRKTRGFFYRGLEQLDALAN